ncbi:CRE-SRXA-6 protein [Caenorhabditis remanei]|uniref:CRE-SRXA-6 protein n=1 Tax=Caenorhabditis remanei TaxID=31234 RepID=E3MF37_CAERE|nr:CRE-SRXA-6 protein [Caenorhabditis remanei]
MLSEIPLFHVVFQLIFCILTSFLLIFDSTLLFLAIFHRNDTNFPVAYLIVMSVCGVLCKIAFITDFAVFLVVNELDYLEYRQFLGKEFTLLGTLTYFIPMFVSVLMTSNRLFIVLRPTDQTVFSQKRIFLYSFGILVRQNLNLNPMPVQILCLVLLLIPYFSTCSVNFMARKLEFQTDCSPDRHPMTRFTNTHLIWIPTTLLLINLTLVLHLKAVRHSVYSKMLQKTSTVSMTSSTQLAQCQKRREQMLMRQALAITVYLSFYEVGTFLMRTFPDTYSSLPQSVRDAYFYFRLETICAMNFFVYFMESSSMRKMLKSFLGCAKKKSSIIGRSHSEAPKVSTATLRT